MTKIIKKILTGVLAFAVTFTTYGCGSNDVSNGSDDSQAAKGRYIETQLNTPEGVTKVTQMLQLSDKTLAVLDSANGVVAKSTDHGETWKIEEIPAITSVINNEGNEISSAVMNKNGEIFFSYVAWDKAVDGDSSYPEKYVKIDAKGNAAPIEMEAAIESGAMSKILMGDNGKLYSLTNAGEIYEIDTQTQSSKLLFSSENKTFHDISLCKKNLIAINNEKVFFYNLETKETIFDDTVLNDMAAAELSYGEWASAFTEGQDENSLYLACSGGLYSHVIGGSVMEQIIDGELTTMGNPSKAVAAVIQDENKNFLIAYEDGTICSYSYDAKAYTVPRKQLNVYSLSDNETVRQAISIMQKDNQDIYVNLEIGISGEDGVTANDAIKTLNTKMLAGEGPDVILLDGMPIDSYIEKGLLEDMNELLLDIEAEGSYFGNILHTYDKNGTYAVPFRYLIPVMTDESQSLSNITDLSALTAQIEADSESGETKTVFGTYTPEETLKKLYLTSSASWINDKGAVDESKLKKYLEAAKKIYDAEQKNLTDADIEDYKSLSMYTADSVKKVNQMNNTTLSENNQVYDYFFKNTQMTYGNLCSIDDFQTMNALLTSEPNLGYALAVGQSSNIFVPNGIVGISSVTKQSELAQDFVKTLLSKDVQSAKLNDGFPVNSDSFDSWTKAADNAEYSVAISDQEGNAIDLELSWPDENSFADLKAKINTLNTACLMDTMIQDTVLELGVDALTGSKSIEDCVNDIIQKISIYYEE